VTHDLYAGGAWKSSGRRSLGPTRLAVTHDLHSQRYETQGTMTVRDGPRYCTGCGARLASDNHDVACRPCQRALHEVSRRPPDVPRDFWQVDRMRDALAERHMGHIVRAYRKHAFHGQRGIAQEAMARWLAISQTQLSRIESGRPIHDLDRLVQWAKVLRIPQELLWFDVPDDGDDVKRRQFLMASGATAVTAMPGGIRGGNVRESALTEQDCAQWLAWELWQRGENVLSGAEIPRPIARVLKALPPAGSIILRDREENYSFAQASLIDFFVAQRVFDRITEGKSDLLATAQTSHDTDQVIRRFVLHQDSSVVELKNWMRAGSTPILRVNSAGILAKIGMPEISDEVITALRQDRDMRHLYLTAVASRVLGMPRDAAGQFVATGATIDRAATGLPEDRVADLAVRLSQEVQHSQDGAARWCSVMLLSHIRQHVPATVTSALQEALRSEPSRENLRAIGTALANADPLDI